MGLTLRPPRRERKTKRPARWQSPPGLRIIGTFDLNFFDSAVLRTGHPFKVIQQALQVDQSHSTYLVSFPERHALHGCVRTKDQSVHHRTTQRRVRAERTRFGQSDVDGLDRATNILLVTLDRSEGVQFFPGTYRMVFWWCWYLHRVQEITGSTSAVVI